MMSKNTSIALTCVLAFSIGSHAMAAAKAAASPAGQLKGTITAWDGAAKQVTIKSDDGKSKSFAWNEKTKVQGVAKLGEHVSVSYANDETGKPWATLIRVDPAAAGSKAPADR